MFSDNRSKLKVTHSERAKIYKTYTFPKMFSAFIYLERIKG